jgi:DNA invertase Pin-like site-specific DNA recombinase
MTTPSFDQATSPKLRAWHLDRAAIVYVRQSTPQQVTDHQESTARQYALTDRAVALGWPRSRVQVIDDDLGKSGQSIEGRPGFQRLLAEVALDRVGLILGLEMSRLARSCKDWHHLLELCARFRVLLADADGVYDPTDYSDRLLLGLTGMMNEAELHVLKQRMHQGKLNKARRGELIVSVPAGYVKLPAGQVVFDPDEQAQDVIRLIFDQFDRQGTVHGVLRFLIAGGIRLPVRRRAGVDRGRLDWRPPCRETVRHILRHPIYAGAYRYGFRPTDTRRQTPGHPKSGRGGGLAAEDCLVFLKDRFAAYITWMLQP